ncbi:hypothetical protein LLT6_09495 [Lactococcus cremoris subsp. cremoris TIFN6]|uniref:Uncharacterized protein n=1 Tax=Lactococcus cremoris subsp. cremoris TIFN6 TaxID=1234876 RepID=T0SIR9_LACLC|nr:hypothetical protein LLT6_09495 [Lactococcus cremoris subsp. cremoris TIFN6]
MVTVCERGKPAAPKATIKKAAKLRLLNILVIPQNKRITNKRARGWLGLA